MSETVILPEMLEAGMTALAEAKAKKLRPHQTVLVVFLAMRAIEEMAEMQKGAGMVH